MISSFDTLLSRATGCPKSIHSRHLFLDTLGTTSFVHSSMCSLCTYHIVLRGLDRSVDGIGASIGQVLAHPLLHMSQQLLPAATGEKSSQEIRNHTTSSYCLEKQLTCPSTYRLVDLQDMW